MHMHAIAEFAGNTAHERPHCRDINFDVFELVTTGRPLRGKQTQIVVGPLVMKFFFLTKCSLTSMNRRNIVAHLRRWFVELTGIAALNVTFYLTTQPKPESTSSVLS